VVDLDDEEAKELAAKLLKRKQDTIRDADDAWERRSGGFNSFVSGFSNKPQDTEQFLKLNTAIRL
jgi:hypothetical protein